MFVLALNNADGDERVQRDSHKIKIKKYDEIRRAAVGAGDDCTVGCLLDYKYYSKHYKLVIINLSKKKELDSDPRSIQQIEFYCKLDANSQMCTVLEKSKETILEFCKGTTKVL